MDPTVTDPEIEPIKGDPAGGVPEPVDEWTSPTREELEAERQAHAEELAAVKKTQADQAAALKRANAESANRKKQIAELAKQHEDDDTKANREATEAALAQLKPVVIKAEAKSALLAAKANPDRVAALTRLLDLNAIEIDGDTVTGLDTQVDQLQTDYPEFFVTEQPVVEPKKPAAPKLDTTGRKAAPIAGPQTPGEQIAALVLGTNRK